MLIMNPFRKKKSCIFFTHRTSSLPQNVDTAVSLISGMPVAATGTSRCGSLRDFTWLELLVSSLLLFRSVWVVKWLLSAVLYTLIHGIQNLWHSGSRPHSFQPFSCSAWCRPFCCSAHWAINVGHTRTSPTTTTQTPDFDRGSTSIDVPICRIRHGLSVDPN